MKMSSSFSGRIKHFAGLEHCPDNRDAASCEGNQRLGMMLPLLPLPIIKCFGRRIFLRNGAKSALIEYPFEGFVASECAAPPGACASPAA